MNHISHPDPFSRTALRALLFVSVAWLSVPVSAHAPVNIVLFIGDGMGQAT